MDTGFGIKVGLHFGFKKYVNLIRVTTGKVFKQGHATKVEHAALTAVKRTKNQDVKKPLGYNNGVHLIPTNRRIN